MYRTENSLLPGGASSWYINHFPPTTNPIRDPSDGRQEGLQETPDTYTTLVRAQETPDEDDLISCDIADEPLEEWEKEVLAIEEMTRLSAHQKMKLEDKCIALQQYIDQCATESLDKAALFIWQMQIKALSAKEDQEVQIPALEFSLPSNILVEKLFACELLERVVGWESTYPQVNLWFSLLVTHGVSQASGLFSAFACATMMQRSMQRLCGPEVPPLGPNNDIVVILPGVGELAIALTAIHPASVFSPLHRPCWMVEVYSEWMDLLQAHSCNEIASPGEAAKVEAEWAACGWVQEHWIVYIKDCFTLRDSISFAGIAPLFAALPYLLSSPDIRYEALQWISHHLSPGSTPPSVGEIKAIEAYLYAMQDKGDMPLEVLRQLQIMQRKIGDHLPEGVLVALQALLVAPIAKPGSAWPARIEEVYGQIVADLVTSNSIEIRLMACDLYYSLRNFGLLAEYRGEGARRLRQESEQRLLSLSDPKGVLSLCGRFVINGPLPLLSPLDNQKWIASLMAGYEEKSIEEKADVLRAMIALSRASEDNEALKPLVAMLQGLRFNPAEWRGHNQNLIEVFALAVSCILPFIERKNIRSWQGLVRQEWVPERYKEPFSQWCDSLGRSKKARAPSKGEVVSERSPLEQEIIDVTESVSKNQIEEAYRTWVNCCIIVIDNKITIPQSLIDVSDALAKYYLDNGQFDRLISVKLFSNKKLLTAPISVIEKENFFYSLLAEVVKRDPLVAYEMWAWGHRSWSRFPVTSLDGIPIIVRIARALLQNIETPLSYPKASAVEAIWHNIAPHIHAGKIPNEVAIFLMRAALLPGDQGGYWFSILRDRYAYEKDLPQASEMFFAKLCQQSNRSRALQWLELSLQKKKICKTKVWEVISGWLQYEIKDLNWKAATALLAKFSKEISQGAHIPQIQEIALTIATGLVEDKDIETLPLLAQHTIKLWHGEDTAPWIKLIGELIDGEDEAVIQPALSLLRVHRDVLSSGLEEAKERYDTAVINCFVCLSLNAPSIEQVSCLQRLISDKQIPPLYDLNSKASIYGHIFMMILRCLRDDSLPDRRKNSIKLFIDKVWESEVVLRGYVSFFFPYMTIKIETLSPTQGLLKAIQELARAIPKDDEPAHFAFSVLWDHVMAQAVESEDIAAVQELLEVDSQLLPGIDCSNHIFSLIRKAEYFTEIPASLVLNALLSNEQKLRLVVEWLYLSMSCEEGDEVACAQRVEPLYDWWISQTWINNGDPEVENAYIHLLDLVLLSSLQGGDIGRGIELFERLTNFILDSPTNDFYSIYRIRTKSALLLDTFSRLSLSGFPMDVVQSRLFQLFNDNIFPLFVYRSHQNEEADETIRSFSRHLNKLHRDAEESHPVFADLLISYLKALLGNGHISGEATLEVAYMTIAYLWVYRGHPNHERRLEGWQDSFPKLKSMVGSIEVPHIQASYHLALDMINQTMTPREGYKWDLTNTHNIAYLYYHTLSQLQNIFYTNRARMALMVAFYGFLEEFKGAILPIETDKPVVQQNAKAIANVYVILADMYVKTAYGLIFSSSFRSREACKEEQELVAVLRARTSKHFQEMRGIANPIAFYTRGIYSKPIQLNTSKGEAIVLEDAYIVFCRKISMRFTLVSDALEILDNPKEEQEFVAGSIAWIIEMGESVILGLQQVLSSKEGVSEVFLAKNQETAIDNCVTTALTIIEGVVTVLSSFSRIKMETNPLAVQTFHHAKQRIHGIGKQLQVVSSNQLVSNNMSDAMKEYSARLEKM